MLSHSHVSKGFGLVELLVAVAVSGLLALGMASIFQNMAGSNNALRGSAGAQSLESSLTQFISQQFNPTSGKPNLCMQHLLTTAFDINQAKGSGLPLAFKSDDQVSTIGGPPTPGGPPVPLPNYDVSVVSLVFKTTSSGTGLLDQATGEPLYLGTLVISLQKMTTSNVTVFGSRYMKDVSLGSLYLAVDGSNNIVNCYGDAQSNLGQTASDACAAMGGVLVPSQKPPCQIPPPCQSPNVFVGYTTGPNNTVVPNCQPSAALAVLSCNKGQYVISNGSGGFVCYP